MKTLLILSTAAMLAFPMLPAAYADPAADIKAAYASFDAAFNKGDAKALAAFYTEDAILLPPTHEVIKGPAEVEKFFTPMLPGTSDHKLELIEATGDNDFVVGTAKWSVNGKDKAGKNQTYSGTATQVFQKQPDGSYKMRVHTFN